MSSSAGTKTKALCVATRCMTAEQFVATFHRFCDESSFFVATLNTRPVGLETPFAIQLADRTPVLRGLCVVLDAWTTPANQFNRPGIRLGIRRLTADSQQIFAKLQTRRAASANEAAPDDLEAAAAAPALPVSDPPASPAPAPGAMLPKPPPLPRVSGRLATDVRTPPPTPIVRPPDLPKPPVTPTGPRPFGAPKSPSTLVTQPLSFIQKPPSIPGGIQPAAPLELKSASTMPMPAPAKLPAAPLELDPPPPVASDVAPDVASDAAPSGKRAKSDTAPDAPPDDRRAKPDTAPDHLRGNPDTAPDEIPDAGRTKPDTARTTPDTARTTPDPTRATPDPTRATPDPTLATPDPTRATPEPAAAAPDPATAAPLDTRPASPPIAAPAAPPKQRASRMPITPMRGNTASGLITLSSLTPPSTAAVARATEELRRAAAARSADDEPTAQAAPLAPPVKPAIAPIVDLATYAALAEPSPMGSPPSPTDGRAPGSDLVLPANPLMNLTDESIEGFVDCTLYEETANFLSVPGVDDGDELAPPPAGSHAAQGASSGAAHAESSAGANPGARPATLPPVGIATPPGMPAYDPDAARRAMAPPPVGGDPGVRPPALPPWATPPGLPGAGAPAPVPVSATLQDPARSADPMTAYETLPPYPGSATMPAGSPGPFAGPPGPGYGARSYPTGSFEAAAMNGAPTATPVPGYADGYAAGYGAGYAPMHPGPEAPARPALRRWMLIAAPVAVALIIVTIVIANTGSPAGSADQAAASEQGAPGSQVAPTATTTPPSPDAASATARPAVATTPLATDAGEGDEGEDDGDGHDEDEDETATTNAGVPVAGDGPCLLSVSSTPAGSVVSIDGQSVGPSPITIAGPCQRRRVDIKHPRYKRSTQWVMINADKQNNLDVTLVRPTHALTVTSMPPGATILIGGRRAGITPTVVQVMGFSGMKVTVKKPGYKPVNKRVYSKRPQDKLFVRLTR